MPDEIISSEDKDVCKNEFILIIQTACDLINIVFA